MPDAQQIRLSQSRAVREATAFLFREVLQRRKPADRVLAAHLRAHREYGSRDRRVISETLYSAFRWWGWLRMVAPRELLELEGTEGPGESAPQAEIAWHRLLLGAWVLDGLPPEGVACLWAEACGLTFEALTALYHAPEPQQRMVKIAAAMGLRDRGSFAWESLVPEWTPAEITCPRPEKEWISWLQRRTPLWLRVQHPDPAAAAGDLRAAGLDPVTHSRLPNALRVDTGAVNLYALPAYRGGAVEVQDLASQAVGAVCAPAPGERWWDACAGGGGKSLLLAALMRGKGTVVATDVRERKLESLRLRARRGGFSNIRVRGWDGGALPADRATFDGVLVNTPCTCSGTWRRNPAARWSAAPSDLADMAALQGRILRNASRGVKFGGVLVYATCSLFDRENERIVESFLGELSSFRLDPFVHPLTGDACGGSLRIWPWDGDCDAMFVARFRRAAASD